MVLLLIFLVLILVVSAVFYFFKRNPSSDLTSLSNNQNPITKLTFEDSLNLKKFNQELVNYNLSKSDEVLRNILNISLGDQVKLVESVKIVKEHNSIVWELSSEAKNLLKTGKIEWVTHNETGKLLPIVKDSNNSKFKELLKGSKSGNLANMAKLTNVVVNISHVISGADLSRKLDEVNNKLDYLIEARKIDKLSKLESLYYELRELISDPNVENEREKIITIHNQIREIRIVWRNEFEEHLDNIEDPKSKSLPFFRKYFSFDRNKDKKVYQKVTALEEEMRLIDYCFALDFAIYGSINQDLSALQIELERFEQTAEKLESKKDFLTGQFPEYNIDNHINYLSSMPDKYSNYISNDFLPDNQEVVPE